MLGDALNIHSHPTIIQFLNATPLLVSIARYIDIDRNG